MDRIDRQLLAALVNDGRATYQELGRLVRLSSNTVADRVRKLRKDGVIRGYRAELDLAVLGRGLQILTDIRLRETVDRAGFERGLVNVPQVIAAMRMTGDYDYLLHVVVANALELEHIVDRLKAELGVREARSRLLLHEVPLGQDRILDV
ncbi:Lrp/AsnC family transcriptional regulator [Kibdelosporangium aridum]|uniref:Lrp/AsnC family transcriptional regulator, leucine-responsive regulatory protein n=1 Tax=Kibdelosporangium aridum TaxID=2030 RepID=A0A1W2AIC7_KIBAR|nr:Lrp/AsnC family transcriptional regulator [Kibdelosporangium aridum]SMC60262.1 Lrp/AsnC family transcriptional regulator, leucine-responsive regulatory protein [Kibdelosporangium aridum]